jgi:hypothetical protein
MEFDEDEELLYADGLDAAILGVGTRCGQPNVVVYDVAKVIDILVNRDGMSYEEAEDFFSFNIEGAWVGEKTPVWVRLLKNEVAGTLYYIDGNAIVH